MSSAAFDAALARKHNAAPAPNAHRERKETAAATRWISQNDPNHKKHKAVQRLRKARAARRTRIHKTR